MATAEEIASLRRFIDEDDETVYTDVELGNRLDAATNTDTLIADIWDEKAGMFAGLVDTKEGNSDRKLSQLHQHALTMSATWRARTGVKSTRSARLRPIERA